MAEHSANSIWIIGLSFFVAMVCAVVTAPDFVPWQFSYLRPDWVVLVLVYWIIALPHRVGLLSAWILGLLMDVLHGSLLGQHAIAFLVVAYVASNLYQRLRMFAVWQQSLVVFGIVGVSQLINYWIESMAGAAEWSYWLLLPALMSAFVWPWIFILLRFLRRFFGVS